METGTETGTGTETWADTEAEKDANTLLSNADANSTRLFLF